MANYECVAFTDTEVVPAKHFESVPSMVQRLKDAGFVFVERSIVKFGKQIGRGGQGSVYEASVLWPDMDKAMKMAVKKFNSQLGMSQGQYPLELWTTEWIGILRPRAFFFDADASLCMLMPLYSSDLRMTLDIEMKIRSGTPLEETDTFSVIMQLALGMRNLHSAGICHRDLKAANILLTTIPMSASEFAHVCLIADFEASEDVKGTAFWRAPEVLMAVRTGIPLTDLQWQAADVYSFGMVCYEIVTGERPFEGKPLYDYDIVINGGRPGLPDHVPEVLRNIIIDCWHPDPECRPDLGEILETLKLYAQNHSCLSSFLDGWERGQRRMYSKPKNLHLELMQLKEIVWRHSEVNGDEIGGFQRSDWGLKYVYFAEKFMELLKIDHHTYPMLSRDYIHLLSFVDYIECQKLRVLMNQSLTGFWSEVEVDCDIRTILRNLTERGHLFMEERGKLAILARNIEMELMRVFQFIELEVNDNDMTVKEKLEVVHDLVMNVKHTCHADATLGMIDNIFKKWDPERTNIEITMFQTHMEFVARHSIIQEQEQDKKEKQEQDKKEEQEQDKKEEQEQDKKEKQEQDQYRILFNAIVGIIVVYLMYQSSYCKTILFQIFGLRVSNFYDIFLGLLCPHLEASFVTQLYHTFPRRTRGFENFILVSELSYRIFYYYLFYRNDQGFRQYFGWIFIQCCIHWVLCACAYLIFRSYEDLYVKFIKRSIISMSEEKLE